jgi:hypothetical protein
LQDSYKIHALNWVETKYTMRYNNFWLEGWESESWKGKPKQSSVFYLKMHVKWLISSIVLPFPSFLVVYECGCGEVGREFCFILSQHCKPFWKGASLIKFKLLNSAFSIECIFYILLIFKQLSNICFLSFKKVWQ